MRNAKILTLVIGLCVFIYFTYLNVGCQNKFESVRATLIGQYPEPILSNRIGNRIICKTRGEDAFVLSIVHPKESFERKIDTSIWTQLSINWSADEKYLTFQIYNPLLKGYDTYLVTLSEPIKKKRLSIFSTTALPPLRFSPSGEFLAQIYNKNGFGLVALNIASDRYQYFSDSTELDLSSDICWLNDSIIYAINDNQRGIIKINIKTHGFEDVYSRPDAIINKVVTNLGNRLAFSLRKKEGDYNRLLILNLDDNSVYELADYHYDAKTMRWISDSTLLVGGTIDGIDQIFKYVLTENRYVEISTSYSLGYLITEGHNSNDILLKKSTFSYPAFVRPFENDSIIYQRKNQSEDSLTLRNLEIGSNRVPVFLFTPRRSHRGNFAYIYLHGGPKLQATAYWDPIKQVVCERGYYYLALNYRGSVGFGFSFSEGASLNDQSEDLRESIEWLHRELKINYKHINIIAESYAAQIVLTLASSTFGPRFGKVLFISPLLSIEEIMVCKEGDYDKMFFFGEIDPFKPYGPSHFGRLRYLIGASRVREYPDEGHHFHKTSTWIDVLSNI